MSEPKQNWRIFELILGVVLLLTFGISILIIGGKDRTITRLNKKIEAIESNDNLLSIDEYEASNRKRLKEDISSYIKDRYSRTSTELALEISKNIMKYSKEYHVPAELLVGMIEVESMFNPMAVSSVDARGLMQVMPEWVPKFNLHDTSELHDIGIGIESGIKVFNIHLEEAKGNVTRALYLYVGKDSEYASQVYSKIGYFVTYRGKRRNNHELVK